MPSWVPDAGISVLILGMAYALASEGAWGATLMFFNVMFAGLITFNFYEPLATQLIAWGMAGAWVDFLASMGIFLVTLVIFRLITDAVAPGMVRFPKPVYHLGRIIFSLGTACMMAAILLCILYTAPVDRRVFGVIDYETQPPFKQGFDRAWLAFVQRSSGYAFSVYDEEAERDPLREFENTRVFDPRGSWLIDHQNARPYAGEGQDDKVPYKTAEETAAAAPAAEPKP